MVSTLISNQTINNSENISITDYLRKFEAFNLKAIEYTHYIHLITESYQPLTNYAITLYKTGDIWQKGTLLSQLPQKIYLLALKTIVNENSFRTILLLASCYKLSTVSSEFYKNPSYKNLPNFLGALFSVVSSLVDIYSHHQNLPQLQILSSLFYLLQKACDISALYLKSESQNSFDKLLDYLNLIDALLKTSKGYFEGDFDRFFDYLTLKPLNKEILISTLQELQQEEILPPEPLSQPLSFSHHLEPDQQVRRDLRPIQTSQTLSSRLREQGYNPFISNEHFSSTEFPAGSFSGMTYVDCEFQEDAFKCNREIRDCLFQKCSFESIDASSMTIINTSFQKCFLDEMNFYAALCKNVHFDDCTITRSYFINTDFDNVTFSKTVFLMSAMATPHVKDTSFIDCHLRTLCLDHSDLYTFNNCVEPDVSLPVLIQFDDSNDSSDLIEKLNQELQIRDQAKSTDSLSTEIRATTFLFGGIIGDIIMNLVMGDTPLETPESHEEIQTFAQTIAEKSPLIFLNVPEKAFSSFGGLTSFVEKKASIVVINTNSQSSQTLLSFALQKKIHFLISGFGIEAWNLIHGKPAQHLITLNPHPQCELLPNDLLGVDESISEQAHLSSWVETSSGNRYYIQPIIHQQTPATPFLKSENGEILGAITDQGSLIIADITPNDDFESFEKSSTASILPTSNFIADKIQRYIENFIFNR